MARSRLGARLFFFFFLILLSDLQTSAVPASPTATVKIRHGCRLSGREGLSAQNPPGRFLEAGPDPGGLEAASTAPDDR